MPETMKSQGKAECHSLTEDEYAECYKPFLQCSNNLEDMMCLIEPVIASFSGKPVSIMSIGAGTGYFENEMVRKFDLNVSHFHAIEPNKDHHKLLKQTMLSWENVQCTIEEKYFTEKYQTQCKFDLVLMSHCLYNMDNIPQVLSKACSLLEENGKRSKCNKQECLQILTDRSISHVVRERPCTLDVTDFMKRQHPGNDVISFLIQTRIEKLPEDLQEDVYEMVMQRAKSDGSGRYILPTPTVIIVASHY
eukprot:Seg385.3 transcript_id=Seg385.3/GoldUCD/mRNA.D3Y31 product="Carnosine N-methyltransferase 2" protein_id=Seg385.3/GoldUCD/D3Y31